MTRGTGRGRLVAGAAAALICGCLIATRADATAFDLAPPFPTTPLHAAVGDVINVSMPPVVAPAGLVVSGSLDAPFPTSSDSTILPRVSTDYDSGGTAHASFSVAHSGTADITVLGASPSFCSPSSTTTSSTTSTVTSNSASHTATSATSTTTSTAFLTTSTTTAATSTRPPSFCIASAVAVQLIVVVASATGVQGAATTVPGAGAGGPPAAGVWLVLGGLALTGGWLARRITRGRP